MDSQDKPQYQRLVLYILALVVGVVGILLLYSKDNTKIPSESLENPSVTISQSRKTYNTPPTMLISSQKTYKATVFTSKGTVIVEFFNKETPKTVNNFIFLAREGFYDELTFHRIIKDFMIQGGDPKGDGSGGPGYKFEDEKISRDYKRGILAMANSGPDTNGSQFFIMHQDYNLPKNYVIFGQVIEGLDTLDKIAQTPTEDNGMGEKSKPVEKVVIEKITIEEK